MANSAEFHWFNSTSGIRIKLEDNARRRLIRKAIDSFGIPGLSKKTGLSECTLKNYLNGVSMTVGGLKKILDALEMNPVDVEKSVIEFGWHKNIRLPIR